VLLRPNRGFALGISLQRHPPNSRSDQFTSPYQSVAFSRRAFSVCQCQMHTRVPRPTFSFSWSSSSFCGARYADTPTRFCFGRKPHPTQVKNHPSFVLRMHPIDFLQRFILC
jgi:hypothetical protein